MQCYIIITRRQYLQFSKSCKQDTLNICRFT